MYVGGIGDVPMDFIFDVNNVAFSPDINLNRGFVPFLGTVCHYDCTNDIVVILSYSSSVIYLVKEASQQAVAHVKIVNSTSDGESIPITLTI